MSSLACPLCGYRFDPATEPSCRWCPLQGGCAMVCCPACGHTTIDPSRSRLAALFDGYLARRRQAKNAADHAGTLAGIPPGGTATVSGFVGDMAPIHRERLQAYGLVPGREVTVVRHAPVTVIRVGNSELALEVELARQVYVGQRDGPLGTPGRDPSRGEQRA